jgi:Family of unknown function (DUF5681)
MSEPQNQDDNLGTDPAVVGATTAADQVRQNQDEKIGAGQSAAGAEAVTNRDYEVGRGRPPKQYQWQKGQSGNPSGRPRKKLDQKATVERIMNEPVVISSQDGKKRKVPKYDALMRSHVTKAIKGDVRAAKFVLDEATRLGVGEEQDGGMSTLSTPKMQAAQSDLVFSNLDLDLLSEGEKIELARLSKVIDLGGDFTALSVADYARMKQITDKGRGKDVTPRA